MPPRAGPTPEATVAAHVEALCSSQPDRRPGSSGNRQATAYAAGVLASAGWRVSTPHFTCLDWWAEEATLEVGEMAIPVTPSPYGSGGAVAGPLVVIDHWAALEGADLTGRILVLGGGIASEPLTPRGYPFYRSEEHVRILDRLEAASPAAILAVTGKHPALCGALDPFPFIEDGEVDIPTANLRPVDAEQVLESAGRIARLDIRAGRRFEHAFNVVATAGTQDRRLTVMAHIDTKPGTPGAVDNAAGVAAVLLLADLLPPAESRDLPVGLELLLVNGEDHYAAPGELAWLAEHEDHLDRIELAINVDGAGYRDGQTAYSTYGLDPAMEALVEGVLLPFPTISPGPLWFQSDHAIFAMRGRPALAFTTDRVEEMLNTLFHTEADTPDMVEPALVTDLARAIAALVRAWPAHPQVDA